MPYSCSRIIRARDLLSPTTTSGNRTTALRYLSVRIAEKYYSLADQKQLGSKQVFPCNVAQRRDKKSEITTHNIVRTCTAKHSDQDSSRKRRCKNIFFSFSVRPVLTLLVQFVYSLSFKGTLKHVIWYSKETTLPIKCVGNRTNCYGIWHF